MPTLESISLAIVLSVTVLSEGYSQSQTPAGIPGLPGTETLGSSADEKRAFVLALAHARTTEPELKYDVSKFKVVGREAATGVLTVQVYGVPLKGSKWQRRASVSFTVLVDPDGKVSEPWWSLRFS